MTIREAVECVCSQCREHFWLSWDEEGPDMAMFYIRDYESGGIYEAYIDCPHCKHRHSLY